jgi:hypothetical protein
MMTNTPRFWFGWLYDEDSGTIVIWDRLQHESQENFVSLYHFKRDAIIKYDKAIVKSKLRPITREEESLTGSALSKYFSARSKHSTELCEEKLKKITFLRESNKQPESEIYQYGIVCEYCDGIGYETGAYGAIACSVCLGWGKIIP